ncbi:DNA replication licensing factor MCM3-like isoform X2 [Hylaeus volcanicus]|uniref:DNA replication licensing factor MCM3-like isoform X2 n=1 Tax=Hylaeus volcanicus TaxID=313075 RepID=UPI0023B824F1|nr:DNA replication licensing factor MCM3-like isoform X2 [Hylaeus volcanicus]
MSHTESFEIDVRYQISSDMYAFLSETTDWYDTVEALVVDGKTRLKLPIEIFDQVAINLSNLILSRPLLYFSACEEGYQRFYDSIVAGHGGVSQGDNKPKTPHLGVSGWLGSHTVTPRGLSARLVNRLVCVEGIVTRCSLLRSKLSRSVHLCDKNAYVITREHYDIHSLQNSSQLVNRGVPKTDKDGNPLKMEVALSDFKDGQTITLQEMPESSPTGQLPRSIEVSLEDDLTDVAKPGDRVRIFGVYRAVAFKKMNRFSGLTRAFLIANSIEHLKGDVLAPEITPFDIRMIKEVTSRSDAFHIISQSMAPSICGHDLVKKGLLLQLLGGQRKVVDNGMKLRGDIHILLVGDPSCGKSQLLRFVMNTSAMTLSTTGRGSSGVGLTAAVTTDKETGERRLEAGAMVLADGGIVCIDEFDKMNSEDRVCIHEVMEQQTVTINKAGIHASLNARTSVLAAANPVYGCFDPMSPLKSQITFPDSLLTRFDLIFIIRDSQSSESDRRICSQVVRQLQYRPSSTSLVTSNTYDQVGGDDEWGILQAKVDSIPKQGDAQYWETSLRSSWVPGSVAAREAAINRISKFYAELRQSLSGDSNTNNTYRQTRIVPTARTLEACVRLATAHAKLKLKTVTDEEDVKVAEELLVYTLTGQPPEGYTKDGTLLDARPPHQSSEGNASCTPKKQRKRSRNLNQDVDTALSDKSLMFLNKKKSKSDYNHSNNDPTTSSLIPIEETSPNCDLDAASQGSVDSLELPELTSGKSCISTKRLKMLMKAIAEIQSSLVADSITPHELVEMVNQRSDKKKFSSSEFLAGLHSLQADNKIMFVDGEIWFI